MNKNLYLFFFALLFFPKINFGQIEKVIVETYYVSAAADTTDLDGGKLEIGAVTYRVYIDLKKGSKLKKIYGDKNHALKFSSTKPFFNNNTGETYGKDLKKNLYSNGTVPLDTWLTIGQTAAKTPDNKANLGVLKTQDSNGSFIGGVNNDGGSSGVPGGLLTNSVAAVGIPLTTSDGMFLQSIPNYTWTTFGLKNFLTGKDSTIFGSLGSKISFSSYQTTLEVKPSMTGVIADSNQILIAQLTTKGQLSFELNVEVEQMVDTVPVIFKYVANGDTLLPDEKVESYLKYPYAPECGCQDPRYLEYKAKYVCSNPSNCINLVVYGCKDTLACNFDSKANFSLPGLCCYPGLCLGREISVVCPKVRGSYAECSLHPNPAQDAVFLDVVIGVTENVSFDVYNYSGTKVLSEDLGAQQFVVNHKIDLAGFSQGLYLIRVKAGTELFNIQFIKN